jgi:cystathionine beta-lyase/cystathionine gamma-synthase
MSDQEKRRRFQTRAVHTHRPLMPEQLSSSTPIFQSSTFRFETNDEFARAIRFDGPGYVYSRGYGNPTIDAFQLAMADLEETESAMSFASGMAAISALFMTVAGAGSRIVAGTALYGGSVSLLRNILPRFGVEATFVDPTDLDQVRDALPGADLFYCETIVNPTTTVPDLAALAGLCREAGVVSAVDNTFASPYLCRPLELGADLVVESATKYLGGHSDVLAGVVAGSRELVRRVRDVQVDTGGSLAPLAAFLVLRGVATLAVRMERHAATAAALAAWLERQDGVVRVHHPSLASHPQHALASRQLTLGGGMLAVELAGGRPAGAAFIDALSITELTASLGSVHTMVVHPPSTTHRQLDDQALADAGIAPGLLRISAGLEDVDDLIADFEVALVAARAAGPALAGARA